MKRKIVIFVLVGIILISVTGCTSSRIVGKRYYIKGSSRNMSYLYFKNKKEVRIEAINGYDYTGLDVTLKYKVKGNNIIVTNTNGSTMTYIYDKSTDCISYGSTKFCSEE